LQNVEGIIVAGNAELPQNVHDVIVADSRLTIPVLGLIKVSTEASFEEIILKSMSLIKSEDIMKEKQYIEDIQDIIRCNSDLLVFGLKNVQKYANTNMLKYALVENGISIENTENKVITFSSFLSSYDGVIGVLYFPSTLAMSEITE
jgi:peptide subunit release factor 1 (eRF1)